MKQESVAISKKLTNRGSVLLDSLRIVSAIIVVIFHSYYQWVPGANNTLDVLGRTAHGAVIVFFVLSGFVIGFTTANDRGKSYYIRARLSRLYSVLLPTLIITFLIQILVRKLNPLLFEQYSRGAALPRYIFSGLFLNEIWFYSSAPPINSPLWSLSYEFWYYVIFGIFFYAKSRKGTLLLVFACLFAGPKILLLLPVWIAGCLAFRLKHPAFIEKWSWFFVFAGLSLAFLCIFSISSVPYSIGVAPFYFSNQFLTDYITAFFIAFSLWSLPQEEEANFRRFSIYLRPIADLTFPIYILHFPLLITWRALFSSESNNEGYMIMATCSVIIVSGFIGLILERQRFIWADMIDGILRFVRSKTRFSFRKA